MWFLYTINNFIFKILDRQFKKDFLWEETKKKIVFKKIKHLFGYVSACYLFLWYFQYSTEKSIASGRFFLFFTTPVSYNEMWYIDYRRYFTFYIIYFTFWFVVYLLSFFIRRIHEVIYVYGTVILMWSWMLLLYQTFPYWYQLEVFAYDDIHIVLLCYTFVYLVTGTLVHLENELDYDEEEIEFMENFNDNIWLEKNQYIIDDILNEKYKEQEFIKSLEESPKADEFTGDLHSIPNMYTVDVKADIEYIIYLNKKRVEDEKEWNIQNLLTFRGRILRLYPDKSITQNYILNIKKVLGILLAFLNTDIDLGETIIELEGRYQRERILRSPAAFKKELIGLTDEEKLVELSHLFVKENVYLDPWWSSKWYKDMTEQEAQWFKWWVSDQVPFLVKIFVIIKRFFLQYKLGVIKAEKTNTALFFRDALYSFFGIKWKKEKFIVKYENGYIAWVRGQPRFVRMDSLDFDPELYNKPTEELPSIFVQILDKFKTGFTSIKNVFMFFFYLITSWGSLTFWIYSIRSIVRIPRIFINILKRIYKKMIRFFMKKYAFFFIYFLPFLMYIRSLLFYFVYNLVSGNFFAKRTEPAGPYSVYNPILKFKKMYIKTLFSFLINKYKIWKSYKSLKKSLRKSKKRKLFLLWSGHNKKAK